MIVRSSYGEPEIVRERTPPEPGHDVKIRTSPVVMLMTLSRPPGGIGQAGALTVRVPAARLAVMEMSAAEEPDPVPEPPAAAVVNANAWAAAMGRPQRFSTFGPTVAV